MNKKNSIWLVTITLAGLGMIGPFATDTYLPSFQEIEAEFGTPEALVQQTLSIYLITFAVMTLIYGTLSDMFGRKPIIIGGLMLFFGASLFAACAPNFECLLIARGLQGLTAGAGIVIGQAVVRDLYGGSTAQQLMANIAMVFSLAPAIAPILGGAIADHLGWRFVFVFIMLYAASMILLTWRALPESLPPEKRQPVNFKNLAEQYRDTLKDKSFMFAAFSTGLSFGGQATYIACASNIIVKILGMPVTQFGWLFIPMITGTVMGSWLSGRLARRFTTPLIVNLGLTFMAIGAAADLICSVWLHDYIGVPYIFFPVTICVFGMSIARPGMTIMSISMRPNTLGLASSLVAFCQTVVFAAISGLIAPLLFGSLMKMSVSLSVCTTVSIVCWILSRFFKQKHCEEHAHFTQ